MKGTADNVCHNNVIVYCAALGDSIGNRLPTPIVLADALPQRIAHITVTACVCTGRNASVRQFRDLHLPYDTNMQDYCIDELNMSPALFYDRFYLLIDGTYYASLDNILAGFCDGKKLTMLARGRGGAPKQSPETEQEEADVNASSSNGQDLSHLLHLGKF